MIRLNRCEDTPTGFDTFDDVRKYINRLVNGEYKQYSNVRVLENSNTKILVEYYENEFDTYHRIEYTHK